MLFYRYCSHCTSKTYGRCYGALAKVDLLSLLQIDKLQLEISLVTIRQTEHKCLLPWQQLDIVHSLRSPLFLAELQDAVDAVQLVVIVSDLAPPQRNNKLLSGHYNKESVNMLSFSK